MVVVESIVSAITALAISLGFEKVQENRGKDGSISITGFKNGSKVTLVKLSNPALGSPQYDLVNLATILEVRNPDLPTYELKNGAGIDKRIFTLGIIPLDANTKTKGLLELWLNGRRLFPVTPASAGMLSGVTSINVPIPPNFGLQIKEKESLQVFLWNGVDATSVSITFAVFVANMQ